MRGIIKTISINLLVLYLVSQIFQGMVFKNGVHSFITSGLFLALSSMIVKPLINIMILPINLITFGLFRWISSAATLYIVTLFLPDFLINEFYFKGFTSLWVDIPVIKTQGFFAIILFSFAISIFNTILHWITK